MHLKCKVIIIWVSVVLLVGCQKNVAEVEEFNKPAQHWYKKIAQSIDAGHMDKADAFYISLKSEHMRSALMSTAIIMLAQAHMQKEEYKLADYYLDEYNRRYAGNANREYIEFMKVKASFLGITNPYKDQKLIMDSIYKAKQFIARYPGSDYAPLVNTVLIKLQMGQYLLNENIAALYARTKKPLAATFYRHKNDNSLFKMADIKAPEKTFLGKIFD